MLGTLTLLAVVALTTPPQADLAISTTGTVLIPNGQSRPTTIKIQNNGPSAASGIVVTDTYSSGVFVSATATDGSCTISGSVTCTIPTLNSGSVTFITVELKPMMTVSGPETTTTHTATITSSSPTDPVSSNNSVTQDVIVRRQPDLGVGFLNVIPNPITAGTTGTCTIDVDNKGPDVGISVNAGGGFNAGTVTSVVTSSNPAFSCTAAMTGISCFASSFAAGDHATFSFTWRAPDAPGAVQANTSITCVDLETTTDFDNRRSNSITVNPGTSGAADLGVSTAYTSPVVAGQNMTFAITATNHGPTDALDVVIKGQTATGTVFVSNGGACTTTFPCNIGTLANGGSATITSTYFVFPSTTGTIGNSGEVSSSTPDPGPAGNLEIVHQTVTTSADLAIATVLNGALVAGQNATFTITVTNSGPSDSQAVSISDPTPAGLTFVSNSGACTTTFPCSLGTLAAGSSVSITSTYSVSPSANGTITNSASVSSMTPDPNSANNSSSASGSPGSAPTTTADLSITKALSTALIAGQNATFTITVMNNGPSPAQAVSVSDPTPAGLLFVSNSGTCMTAFPCNLGTLASGATAAITSTYSVPPGGEGNITNTATVSSVTTDPNGANNSATVSRSINARCPSAAPLGLSPGDDQHNVSVNGELAWSNVGAAGYVVYLDGDSCSKFLIATGTTSTPFFGLEPGTTYHWRVEAVTPGCPTLSSSCHQFTTAPSGRKRLRR